VIAAGPALAQDAPGAKLYAAHCVTCHQVGGVGTPGLAPPLSGTLAHAASKAGRAYLSSVVVAGLSGPIDVQGQRYGGFMPSFAPVLNDADAAAVLGYVLGELNKAALPADFTPISAAEVAAARAKALKPNDVHKLRASALAAR
jgi:mono/diheme cytochrome c family protein